MNTPYFKIPEAERLSLTDADLIIAIKLEAIDRGIDLPTSLDESLQRSGAKGFSIPADTSKVFEICAKTSTYGSADRTGIAFQSLEAAQRALEGAFAIVSEGYDARKKSLLVNPFESFEIRVAHLLYTPEKGYWTKLTELTENSESFDQLCEECRSDLERVRQKDYDRRVLQVQRKEYLSLAGGNVEIARAFWAKTKHTSFPEEVVT